MKVEKRLGEWKNDNDGSGDFFVTKSGETFVFVGLDEDGTAWMRCTTNPELPLVKSEDLN